MSNLIKHAKKELDLIYSEEDLKEGLNKYAYDAIMELIEVFSKQGHSNNSAGYVISAFKTLAMFDTIAPLTGEDNEWRLIADEPEPKWQNIRNSAVFLPKDETKLEDVCYTKNIEKWLKFINQRETDPGTHNIFDYEIIKNAEAFALSPVFSCNGKIEACSTFASDSLKEIKDSLNGKKYILYCISWQAIAEPINESDMKSLNITLDKTEDISGNFYRIGKNPKLRILFRGHILEN